MDSLLSLVASSGQGHNGVKTDMKSHSNCLKISRICLPILLIATKAGIFECSCPYKFKTCSFFYEILLLNFFNFQLVTSWRLVEAKSHTTVKGCKFKGCFVAQYCGVSLLICLLSIYLLEEIY